MLRNNASCPLCDNPRVSDPTPPRSPVRSISPVTSAAGPSSLEGCVPSADKTLCERCGGEMYRMHAVWRCSDCGFKTDCCGW